MIRRVHASFWATSWAVYDSDAQGDPSTPQAVFAAPDFCRDPDDSPEARLEVLQTIADGFGRHPDLPKFTSPGEVTEWLDAMRANPTYFIEGEALAVQCPVCLAKAGHFCVSQNRYPISGYNVNPHRERILYCRGHHRRGLIGQ